MGSGGLSQARRRTGRSHNNSQLDPQPQHMPRLTKVHFIYQREKEEKKKPFEFLTLKTAAISLSQCRVKSVEGQTEVAINAAVMKRANVLLREKMSATAPRAGDVHAQIPG